jgi:dTDP-4-dehydrorhamnose 3,5-epimerase
MTITPTDIPDVLLVEPRVFGDERGFFMETYRASRLAEAGVSAEFVQDNHSGSRRGILRGLHYQIRRPQGKLVRAVAGEIYDVAVDVRRDSPTCGRWVGYRLSAENRRQLWIPPGFAHGFYVVSEWAEVVYKATDYYAPEWERTVRWDDPEVGIAWPLAGGPPSLSAKDAAGKPLAEAELFEARRRPE